MAQFSRSTSSWGARRAYNSPIAANSRPHIAFCWRAASVMTSITPASSTPTRVGTTCGDASDSNIYSIIPRPTDKLEAHNAAGAATGGHVGERGLDVVEADPSRHQRLEVEQAATGEGGQHRDIPRRVAGAVDAALNCLAFDHQ